ncbi:MAG: MFS transporter [Pseudomonadales bacterium]|nr:MFS transporter [Pseudomonadales bacterium]
MTDIRVKASDQAILSWKDACLVYLQPRVILMLLLGFSAGIPFLLVYSTLTAWLTEVGVTRTAIGFFAWVGVTYSVKFFWAPFVDRLSIPILGRMLGQRRSWMLLGQIGIAGGLWLLSTLNPQDDLSLFAVVAVLIAFSSATQDIAIDAFRIEAADPRYQGAMSASYVFGYRLALLVAGAGALYLADYYSWVVSYRLMACTLGVGVIAVVLSKEPEQRSTTELNELEESLVVKLDAFMNKRSYLPEKIQGVLHWVMMAIVCPFLDFFKRNGRFGLVLLLFIGVFRLSDITMGIMAYPFYLDMGFSKSEIASVAKLFGFMMSMVGAVFGGVVVVRYGILKPLLLGAGLVAVTNLLFAVLAATDASLWGLALVISADNFSGGLSNTAFIAYLSSLTNKAYTATQYALFSSLMTLPGKVISGFSGMVVDYSGYVTFFIYAASVGIPAILLVLLLIKKERIELS